MPHKPLKPCRFPGCNKLTSGPYCEEHAALVAKHYNKYVRAPNYHKRYGRDWQKIRKRYVTSHPLCEMCLKEGRIIPVSEVHHILPIDRGGGNEDSNLMSLCHSCHEKFHNRGKG